MTMTRRDWWLGVALVTLAIVLHTAFPRYEWRDVRGVTVVRIDRWTGRVVRGHYNENHAWQVYEDLVPIGAVVPQRTDPAAYGGVRVPPEKDVSPAAFGGVLVGQGDIALPRQATPGETLGMALRTQALLAQADPLGAVAAFERAGATQAAERRVPSG